MCLNFDFRNPHNFSTKGFTFSPFRLFAFFPFRLFAFLPLLFIVWISAGPIFARQLPKPLSPKETVRQFYELLRQQKYKEAFQLTVYNPAVETLPPTLLKEFEPDFLAMAEVIPEKIELSGEQITGDTATVFMKVSPQKLEPIENISNDKNFNKMGIKEKTSTAQQQQTDQIPVNLIRVNGKWLVGDLETQELVTVHGANFFFLDRAGIFQRMQSNEAQMYDLMNTLITIEQGYAKMNRDTYATIPELVMQDILQPEVGRGKMFGYSFDLELSQDRKSFTIYATPDEHNKSGRFSYYADVNGVQFKNNGGVKFIPATESAKNK